MKAQITENPMTDQQEMQFSADLEDNMQEEETHEIATKAGCLRC